MTDIGSPVSGPSGTGERAHRYFHVCHGNRRHRRIIEQFADAAKRCQQGGFVPEGGKYLLAGIGDAVSGRNIHAALYDVPRICKDI